MSDSNNFDIRRLDGGLLLVFRELLQRRRATEAARRLGLSQSAVSHALSRLRDLFGDPLFVRRPHGLEPTRRALELGPRVEALLDLAGGLLSGDDGFDAAASRRSFNLGAPGYLATLAGPGLLRALRREAPQAAVVWRTLLLEPALSALRYGEIDVALGHFGPLPAGLQSETLYEDRYCVVARHDHPDLGPGPAIEATAYAGLGHVWVGHPDGPLSGEAMHDRRQLAAAYGSLPDRGTVASHTYVPQWEQALLLVAASNAIADCPRRLARHLAPLLDLAIYDAPYDSPRLTVQAVRRAGTADPGVDWLMRQMCAALSAE